MPKHEPMTAKAIGNRIKSKGLQKLKWYCQMCQKQCRDENGYKCHTMSEAHQRQLLLFGENPNKFMDSFTKDFEKGYLENLRRLHGTKRTFANLVYQDYIKDRDHIHMNSTSWHTLTDFVQYLGKTGKCVVDHTEKGWFVTYIDRDPETIARQAKLARMESRELDDEERMAIALEKMMERDAGRSAPEKHADSSSPTEFKRDDEGEKIALDLNSLPDSKRFSSFMPVPAPLKKVADVFTKPFPKTKFSSTFKTDDDCSSVRSEPSGTSSKKRKIDEYCEQLKAKHAHVVAGKSKPVAANNSEPSTFAAAAADDSPWLIAGIVVKIATRDLGESFVKRKAFVREVLKDRYTAIVELEAAENDADSAAPIRVKVDQTHVETVIPRLGRRVLFVRGKHRGQEAEMLDIDYDRFCVTVKLKGDRNHSSEVITNVAYDHISKLA